MTATTVLIWTVAPASALISVSTPAAGDGISASTLSVEISKSGSSRSHLVADLLEPFGNGALKDGLAHLRHDDFGCRTGSSRGGLCRGGRSRCLLCRGRLRSFGRGLRPGAQVRRLAFEPASSITATTVLICTVAPSATLISLSTPAAGEGISASTLSVEISKSGSSRSTVSPGFLSHLVIVPSKIDSPIWGITISVGM